MAPPPPIQRGTKKNSSSPRSKTPTTTTSPRRSAATTTPISPPPTPILTLTPPPAPQPEQEPEPEQSQSQQSKDQTDDPSNDPEWGDDMTTFPSPTSTSLTANITTRYKNNIFYTSAGSTLIAVNPYRDVSVNNGMVGKAMLSGSNSPNKSLMKPTPKKGGKTDEFASASSTSIRRKPHPYVVAHDSLLSLKTNRKNAFIVVTGGKGAGKRCMADMVVKRFIEVEENEIETSSSSSSSSSTSTSTSNALSTPSKSQIQSQSQSNNTNNNLTTALRNALEILTAFGSSPFPPQKKSTSKSNPPPSKPRLKSKSNFGRLVKLHYDAELRLSAAEVTTYLLDTERVCLQRKGECSFSVFYTLLESGCVDFKVGDVGSYRYLNSSSSSKSSSSKSFSKSSSKSKQSSSVASQSMAFTSLLTSLQSIGLTPQTTTSIFNVLLGILELGNIEFTEDSDGNACFDEGMVKRVRVVDVLLGINTGDGDGDGDDNATSTLQSTLLTKSPPSTPITQNPRHTPRTTPIKIKIKPNEAYAQLNTLSKTLYSSIFAFLVTCINVRLNEFSVDYLGADGYDTGYDGVDMGMGMDMDGGGVKGLNGRDDLFVGVLDLFAFVDNDNDAASDDDGSGNGDVKGVGFYGLCKNYVTEKMRQQIVKCMYKCDDGVLSTSSFIDDDDSNSNILNSTVGYIDNLYIVEVLDKKPQGILCMLDEACRYPRNTDHSFLQKIILTHTRQRKGKGKGGNVVSVCADRTSFASASASSGSGSSGCMFVIRHSLEDETTYDVTGFLEKNKERLGRHVCECFEGSGNEVIRGLFVASSSSSSSSSSSGAALTPTTTTSRASSSSPIPSASASPSHSNSNSMSNSLSRSNSNTLTSPSSSSQQQQSSTATATATLNISKKLTETMTKLCLEIDSSTLTNITCISPNPTFTTTTTNTNIDNIDIDTKHVNDQLISHDAIAAVKMMQDGYTYRATYLDFYDEFIIVVPAGVDSSLALVPGEDADFKGLCRVLLGFLFSLCNASPASSHHHTRMNESYQSNNITFGSTSIHIKHSTITTFNILRTLKNKQMDRSTVLLQSQWRKTYQTSRLTLLKKGVSRAQATWRAIYYRKKYALQQHAIVIVQTCAMGYIARILFKRLKNCTRVIRRFYAKVNLSVKWTKARSTVRALHSLSRAYIVRQHVNRMLSAVMILQTHARVFLSKNKVHYNMVRVAMRIQGWVRGYKDRSQMREAVLYLRGKRRERFRARAVRKAQNRFKCLMVKRRYEQIRKACKALQRAARAVSVRARYVSMRLAAIGLQAGFRGMVARNVARVRRNEKMVSEERHLVSKANAREAKLLSNLNAARTMSGLGLGTNGKLRSFRLDIMDVDVQFDNAGVYPQGWSSQILELDEELAKKGRRIASVCVGSAHTVALTDTGDVWTWGWSEAGQLGHGSFKWEEKPRPLENLRLGGLGGGKGGGGKLVIKEIAAGEDHTVALSSDGKIFTWGSGRRGQLGHGDFKNLSFPRCIQSLKWASSGLSCGSYHTAAIGHNGALYTWGAVVSTGGVSVSVTSTANENENEHVNERGDVCAPCSMKEVLKVRVKKVCCGSMFTIALTFEGEVYAWGDNSFNQLGGEREVGDWKPRGIEGMCRSVSVSVSTTNGSGIGINTTNNSSSPSKSKSKAKTIYAHNTPFDQITSISAGPLHSAACTVSGSVLTWGCNTHGNLGCSDTDPYIGIHSVTGDLTDKKVAVVSAGCRHTAALTADGDVFVWGVTTLSSRDYKPIPNLPPSFKMRDRQLGREPVQTTNTSPLKVYRVGQGHTTAIELMSTWSRNVSCLSVTIRQRYSEMPVFDDGSIDWKAVILKRVNALIAKGGNKGDDMDMNMGNMGKKKRPEFVKGDEMEFVLTSHMDAVGTMKATASSSSSSSLPSSMSSTLPVTIPITMTMPLKSPRNSPIKNGNNGNVNNGSPTGIFFANSNSNSSFNANVNTAGMSSVNVNAAKLNPKINPKLKLNIHTRMNTSSATSFIMSPPAINTPSVKHSSSSNNSYGHGNNNRNGGGSNTTLTSTSTSSASFKFKFEGTSIPIPQSSHTTTIITGHLLRLMSSETLRDFAKKLKSPSTSIHPKKHQHQHSSPPKDFHRRGGETTLTAGERSVNYFRKHGFRDAVDDEVVVKREKGWDKYHASRRDKMWGFDKDTSWDKAGNGSCNGDGSGGGSGNDGNKKPFSITRELKKRDLASLKKSQTLLTPGTLPYEIEESRLRNEAKNRKSRDVKSRQHAIMVKYRKAREGKRGVGDGDMLGYFNTEHLVAASRYEEVGGGYDDFLDGDGHGDFEGEFGGDGSVSVGSSELDSISVDDGDGKRRAKGRVSRRKVDAKVAVAVSEQQERNLRQMKRFGLR